MDELLLAWRALFTGPAEGLSAEERARINRYNSRHEDLFQRWAERRLSPYWARVELVDYYVRRGRQQVEQRFFRRVED